MIWYYVVFLAAFLPGLLVFEPKHLRGSRLVIYGSGFLLIALFGLQLGGSKVLLGTLASDLITAAVLALMAALGSVALTLGWFYLVDSVARQEPRPLRKTTNPIQAPSTMKMWWPLGLFVVSGVLGRLTGFVPSSTMIQVPLLALIAGVGVQAGADCRQLWQGGGWKLRSEQAVLLAGLPVAVIGGSLLLAAGVSPMLPLSWAECLICTAPLGWQTLGGPLVQQLEGVRLGNLAFATNMFRDVVSLVLIPLVARGPGRCVLAVAPGGVSSMDVLLPVITLSSDASCTIHALWVGACCAFWAPILIWVISRVAM